ncbi:MAG: hypothetical protein IT430_19965 [Phycisphaerales bacterium]|nr:hypothetical protein [Phycisphaerales bacterium]
MDTPDEDAATGWIAADAMSCNVAVTLALALLGALTITSAPRTDSARQVRAAGGGLADDGPPPVQVEIRGSTVRVAGRDFGLDVPAAWTAAIGASVGDGAPVVIGVGKGTDFSAFDRIARAARAAGASKTTYVTRE